MTPSRIALVQGVYYLATGIWPLVSIGSFERITGPKRDRWLVKTVALLALAGGSVLVGRARARRPADDLGVGLALAFAASSLWYGGTGRISRVYLLDGLAEAGIAALWTASRREGR